MLGSLTALLLVLVASDGTPVLPWLLNICPSPVWIADGEQTDARFGTVAKAGDVNGDGYDDVLVGAYNEDDPELDEGKVFLYLGGPSGLSTTAAWTATPHQAGARFGDKLSGCGDVNGDGYDDVIIGAATYDHGQTDEGAAFLYLGSPSGLSADPVWSAEGNQEGAQFGACAMGAGDVNGDGYDDVILGSWLYDHGQTDEGFAAVYLGSPSGLGSTPAWTGESNSAGAAYGYFCTGAGDLNGDGYGDVVVGARRFSGNGIDREGRVYVYYGSPMGLGTTPWIKDGGQLRGELGNSPAGAGDVNGDGYDDLLVNAFRYDHPQKDEGIAYLFLGSPTGLGSTPAWTGEADQDLAAYGYHVDSAGDVNGDGFADVLVTASDFDVPSFADAGRAYVYLGSSHGLASIPAWIQDGDQVGGGLGNAGRGVGDVNGDGFDDIATGALYEDVGANTDAGRAYVFYGCAGGSTDVPVTSAPQIEGAQPNPFVHSTDISFSLPHAGRVRLSIHDLSGRRVVDLIDGPLEAGRHVLRWDGRGRDGSRVAAGMYFARIAEEQSVRSMKLVRLP